MENYKKRKMQLRTLISVLMILLSPTTLYAQSTSVSTQTTKCSDVIKACDLALRSKDDAISARDAEISQANVLLKAQAKDISDLNRSADAWYNSKILWVIIGAGVGGYLVKR